MFPFLPVAILPLHLTILKHRNITTTLPRYQQFRGLEKAENPIKKAAISKNGGFHTGPRAGA
jgi:hypothetical protein